MPDYDELIKQSQANVKSLSEKLKELDELYQKIEAIKKDSEDIPSRFNKKFEEIKRLSENYIDTLGTATKNYLDGNNSLFTTKLNDLSTNIKNLQSNIEVLKKQLERLEGVDLEKNFDKLQKNLAEIFGAINTINLTLTNVIQTLTGVVQSLGTIQTALDSNHKEVMMFVNDFSKITEKHLSEQDKQTTKNMELVESKINFLSEQNELLKKEARTSRVIQLVGFTLLIISIIYLIIK